MNGGFSKGFLRTYRVLKWNRRFEITLLVLCSSLFLLGLFAVSSHRLGDQSQILLLIEGIIGRADFAIFSSIIVVSYFVMMLMYYFLYDFLQKLYDEEFDAVKASMQGAPINSVSEAFQDDLDRYLDLSRPLFGETKKAVLVNLGLAAAYATGYLAFIFRMYFG